MRALSALILSTALALPLASTAFAEDAVRSISVTGTGTIEAAPDARQDCRRGPGREFEGN